MRVIRTPLVAVFVGAWLAVVATASADERLCDATVETPVFAGSSELEGIYSGSWEKIAEGERNLRVIRLCSAIIIHKVNENEVRYTYVFKNKISGGQVSKLNGNEFRRGSVPYSFKKSCEITARGERDFVGTFKKVDCGRPTAPKQQAVTPTG